MRIVPLRLGLLKETGLLSIFSIIGEGILKKFAASHRSISYRRMRCLGCPALGESTLRVFGVCVCPVAALRAPGAMLRR